MNVGFVILTRDDLIISTARNADRVVGMLGDYYNICPIYVMDCIKNFRDRIENEFCADDSHLYSKIMFYRLQDFFKTLKNEIACTELLPIRIENEHNTTKELMEEILG